VASVASVASPSPQQRTGPAEALSTDGSAGAYEPASYSSYDDVDRDEERASQSPQPGSSAVRTRRHSHVGASGLLSLVLLMALCLAPLFCACAYALITLHRKLSRAAYETVPRAEMGPAPDSLEEEHEPEQGGAGGSSFSGLSTSDMVAAPSAVCGQHAEPLLSVSTVNDFDRRGPSQALPARRCDADYGAGKGSSAPPLTSTHDFGMAGENSTVADGSTPPASAVPLLTGPPRSGFGKAADAVLQAALEKQRAHTDEVLRRALAEKERIFEGMREQSKREMAGGAHEKYSYT
jgi:hypothetical protein